MELRPRKGRSAPSTPVVPKPSPKTTPHKKQTSQPPPSILILSDDEDAKEDVAPKEMHKDAVAAENGGDQCEKVDSAPKDSVATALMRDDNDENAKVISTPKDSVAAVSIGNGDVKSPKVVSYPKDSIAAASTSHDDDEAIVDVAPKGIHIDLVSKDCLEDVDESANVDASSKVVHTASLATTSTETSDDEDEDEDEGEMASVFFNSMKAHLQNILEPSMQESREANQEIASSEFPKCAVTEPLADGRLTGIGLSWSPEVVLSASKTSTTKAGKSRSIVGASPDTIWGRDRCLQDGLCVPPVDPVKLNKLARKQKADTAGAKWFNLSAPAITPELKKELQLLKLRGALDPKRHYKAEDSKGLPKFFQVGTVIGGPADFYSGRLTKKEQKSSLAGELLSDSSLTTYRKRKYMEIQDQKQAGGKGFWKKKKSKRTPAWAKI